MRLSSEIWRFSPRAMRQVGLPIVLLLAGCAQNHAIWFKNRATGEVVTACGPIAGLAAAVTAVERACVEAYKEQGWVRVPRSE